MKILLNYQKIKKFPIHSKMLVLPLQREIQQLEKDLANKKNKLLEMSERLPGEIKIKAEREKKTEVVHKGLFKKKQ